MKKSKESSWTHMTLTPRGAFLEASARVAFEKVETIRAISLRNSGNNNKQQIAPNLLRGHAPQRTRRLSLFAHKFSAAATII